MFSRALHGSRAAPTADGCSAHPSTIRCRPASHLWHPSRPSPLLPTHPVRSPADSRWRSRRRCMPLDKEPGPTRARPRLRTRCPTPFRAMACSARRPPWATQGLGPVHGPAGPSSWKTWHSKTLFSKQQSSDGRPGCRSPARLFRPGARSLARSLVRSCVCVCECLRAFVHESAHAHTRVWLEGSGTGPGGPLIRPYAAGGARQHTRGRRLACAPPSAPPWLPRGLRRHTIPVNPPAGARLGRPAPPVRAISPTPRRGGGPRPAG